MSKKTFFLIIILLFFARLIYGLCSEFWFPDEKQIYLLGLKFYATGLWPYLGPDVVYTQTQIPGALQGLLVGLPLILFHIPESPIIFLNLISFSSLYLLSWYISKRIPEVPKWFVWIFILTAPWTLVYGTRVINPSYVLPFSILFFISFFELSVFRSKPILNSKLYFFLMSISVGFIMQLHLSWVLLIPFLVFALLLQWKVERKKFFSNVTILMLGFLIGISTLIPTYLMYNISSGGTEKNIVFQFSNFENILTVLTRFLSFASFEVPYMLGGSTDQRLEVISNHLWMAPFAGVLLLVGFAQVIFYVWSFFRKNHHVEWNWIRWITFASFSLIFFSFFFSVKGPSSHTFYVMFPVALIYGFYCYSTILNFPKIKMAFAIYLIFGILFHIGLGMENYKVRSLYVNRNIVQKAIDEKNYKILGLRRADEWGHGY